eukprot:280709-Rhodomonas_salina.1
MQAQTPSSQAGAFAFAQVISGGGLQRTRYYNSNINEAMRVSVSKREPRANKPQTAQENHKQSQVLTSGTGTVPQDQKMAYASVLTWRIAVLYLHTDASIRR